MLKTFLIEYSILNKQGKVIYPNKIMKVKNQLNEFLAKVRLEEYCIKKYPMFGSMTIHSCKESNEIMDIFDSIFKTKFFN